MRHTTTITCIALVLINHQSAEGGNSHSSDVDTTAFRVTDKPLDTVVIDDVLWVSIISLTVIAIAWLCCFWETTYAPPPNGIHCDPCCNDGVIRVRIERNDYAGCKKDRQSAVLHSQTEPMPSVAEEEEADVFRSAQR